MNESKLNLGAGKDWSKPGWVVLDHKKNKSIQAWNMPYDDNIFVVVFCSHMFEHISHVKIEQIIYEINRVMKIGGTLRVLTPDLKKLASAYVNNNVELMDCFISESGSGIRTDLGLGQALMGFIISNGSDSVLFDSEIRNAVCGYAHLFCYDFEMLKGLLSFWGFSDIKQCSIDESAIPEHKELRDGGYDGIKDHSLIVECIKDRNVAYDEKKCLLIQQHVTRHRHSLDSKPLTCRFVKYLSFADDVIKRIRSGDISP